MKALVLNTSVVCAAGQPHRSSKRNLNKITPFTPSTANSAFQSPGLNNKQAPSPASNSIQTRAYFADQATDSLVVESSPMVNREIVLFLFQLEMDAQLQRALTFDDFAKVQEIRKRREKIDSTLAELSKLKGAACGARCASRSEEFDFAPEVLTLKARLQDAIKDENFPEAATLRDRIAELENKTKAQTAESANVLALLSEPRFALGEMVVHTEKGYRGVVAGWDLACCETSEWQTATGVPNLTRGAQQVFYHVLVDSSDWPEDPEDQPPVAYVAEDLLDAASLANFESLEPLDYTFQHAYSYYLFLGSDGHGNMIPCRQLRGKYNVQRADVYAPWQESDEEEDNDDGSDGGDGSDNGSWGGGSILPGIDMRSLD